LSNQLSADIGEEDSRSFCFCGQFGENFCNFFKLLFHEGEKRNVYLSNVGDNFFLVVVFDVSVTLGLVRIYTKKAIQSLLKIFEETEDDEEAKKDIFDSDFSDLLGDMLDESFK
jgi:hypothetical protein